MSSQSISPEERLRHLEGHYADRVTAFRQRLAHLGLSRVLIVLLDIGKNVHWATASLASGLELVRPHRLLTTKVGLTLAAFLELGIMPFRGLLGTLGVLGSFGAWAVLGGAWWLWQKGTQPTAWLVERRLDFWCLLLIAFWLGFVSRLAVASRFELRHSQANVNARFQYLSTIALVFILIWLVAVASPLAIVYAAPACSLGIIFGCDFIQTSLPLTGRMRERPSV